MFQRFFRRNPIAPRAVGGFAPRTGSASDWFAVEVMEPRILLSAAPIAPPLILSDVSALPENATTRDSMVQHSPASTSDIVAPVTVDTHHIFGKTTELPTAPEVAPISPSGVDVFVAQATTADFEIDAIAHDSAVLPATESTAILVTAETVTQPSAGSDFTAHVAEDSSAPVAPVTDTMAAELVATLRAANGPPAGDQPTTPVVTPSFDSTFNSALQTAGADPSQAIVLDGEPLSAASDATARISAQSAVPTAAPTSGALDFSLDASLLNSSGGGDVRLTGPVSQNANGITIGVTGKLAGNGTVSGDLTNLGLISPGNSPGILSESGNLVFGRAGTVLIEVGGTRAGPGSAPGSTLDGYDQIQVAGKATFGGTLDVQLINGFVPTVGQSFDIVTYSSYSGNFDHYDGLIFSNGFFFQPVFSATKLTLQVVSVDDSQARLSLLNLGIVHPVDYVREVVRRAGDLDGSGAQFLWQSATELLGNHTSISYSMSTMGADLTMVITAHQMILGVVGASAFIGSQDVGVKLNRLRLGFVLNDDFTYAIDASGAAAIEGVPQLDLSGTLRIRGNTTGAGVNQAIDFPLAAGGTERISMAVGENEGLQIGGDLNLGVADFTHLVGSFSFEQSTKSTVTVDADGNVVVTEERQMVMGITAASSVLKAGDDSLMTLTEGQGAFLLTAAGMAGEMSVKVAVNASSDIFFTGAFTLAINTLGVEVNESVSV
ncbi:MAG: LEPR-XLL domain-containing protein, partial [Akkermansiaceae bacterium]|nr:LEPR-XLL domain-containing protein [Akkermansiaceae bacterium]